MQTIKCVVVGDGNVGKTCLLNSYGMNAFLTQSEPTIFDTCASNLVVDGKQINLIIWDTAGGDVDSRIKMVIYSKTDVFIICFSIASRSSLENVQTKWYPEIRQYCPDTPIILVGNKLDLRDNRLTADQPQENNCRKISYQQGLGMSEEISAMKYLECSARNGTGMDVIFLEAARACLYSAPRPSRRSSILTHIQKLQRNIFE